jgi:hypothetical protein
MFFWGGLNLVTVPMMLTWAHFANISKLSQKSVARSSTG